MLLSPGVTPNGNAGVAGSFASNRNYPTLAITVAGGSPGSTVYLMDGATHNDPGTNLNLPVPFPDALQEFKVETSALSARYGQHAAAVVNVATKAGTNQFHGSAFAFNRDGRFNAKNAFALTKDSLKRNQFGGGIGGPLVPNRLFFFGAYQGTDIETAPNTLNAFTPTADMLRGDFTALASPQCNSGRQVALRAPFVDNRIDPSQFNPVALRYLQVHSPFRAIRAGASSMGIQRRAPITSTSAASTTRLRRITPFSGATSTSTTTRRTISTEPMR